VSPHEIAKNSLKLLIFRGEGSTSFKVIEVNIPKKLVCYDKQHVCAYLQPFHAERANSGKLKTFRGTFFHAFVRRKHPHSAARNFVTKTRDLGATHSEDFVILP